MIGSKLSVLVDGTRLTAPLKPATIIAFERKWKISLTAAFSTNNVFWEHLYFLGWQAEKDSGAVVKIFDEWLKTIKKVDIVEAPKG